MTRIAIVGSGVAATVFARQILSSAGDHRITMIEAGPEFENGRYRQWLDTLMANTNPYERFIDDPREEHERFGLRGSRLFVKGGTTNHWGGWSPRFKPEDFELRSRTGIGADWPISYEDLAPYYTIAETLLGIEGDSLNDDPPRYGDRFPFEAAPYTLNDQPVIDALESLEVSWSHLPKARNGDRCVTVGTCRSCPVGARYTANQDLSQLQSEAGDRLELLTDTVVTSIDMSSKRHARGVQTLNSRTGAEALIEADDIVVCAGTIESAKLLLASAGAFWPDGIGNDSGHLGRHLVGHPLLYAEGVRPGNPDRIEQELGFVTLACRHYDSPEYQREGKMLFGRVGDDGATNIGREIVNGMSRRDIERKMTEGLHVAFEVSIEQFESPENRVRLGRGADRLGLRTTQLEFGVNQTTQAAIGTYESRIAEILRAAGCAEESLSIFRLKPDGAHATSTCRMSASDSDGVVDGDLRVHGTENVRVCSNAVYPNITAANPTLTVAALAARLAEHMSANAGHGPAVSISPPTRNQ